MSKKDSLVRKQQRDFSLILTKYEMLALNLFRWEIPKEVKGLESRHIESFMYSHGLASFYDNKDCGFVLLPSSYSTGVNIYGEGNEFMVTSLNGLISENVKRDDCVPLYNNDLHIPTREYIVEFAQKMFEVEKAINTNIRQQKFPWFIKTNKKNEFSVKSLFDKIETGEYNIFTGENIDTSVIDTANLSTPYVADRLESYRYELERQLLTFLGINNTYEKKERLVTDEINANNTQTINNVDLMFKQRLEFCKQVKEKYGLEFKVYRVEEEISLKEKIKEKIFEDENILLDEKIELIEDLRKGSVIQNVLSKFRSIYNRVKTLTKGDDI